MIASACLAVLAGSPSALTGQGVPVPAKTRSAEKTQGTELKKDSEKTKSRASPNSVREIEKIRPGYAPIADHSTELGPAEKAVRQQERARRTSERQDVELRKTERSSKPSLGGLGTLAAQVARQGVERRRAPDPTQDVEQRERAFESHTRDLSPADRERMNELLKAFHIPPPLDFSPKPEPIDVTPIFGPREPPKKGLTPPTTAQSVVPLRGTRELERFSRERFGSRQETETTQRWLSELGYYHGPIHGVAGPLTHAAVEDFAKREGSLSEDGLRRAALRKLRRDGSLSPFLQLQVNSNAPRLLADLGFPQSDQSQEEAVRQFQQFHRIQATGRINPETADAILEDFGMLAQVKVAGDAPLFGLAPQSLFRHFHESVGSFTDDQQSYYLVRRRAPELLITDQNGRMVRLSGPLATQAFYDARRRVAQEKSSRDLAFLVATPQSTDPNSPVVLQIGSQSIPFSRAEFQELLESPSSLSLEKLVGIELGRTTASSAIVVLSDGTFSKPHDAGQLPGILNVSPAKLAAAVKTLFGGTRDVFLANDAETAIEHASTLPSLTIKSSSDLTIYTAKTLTDYGSMENLKKPLEKAGVRVVDEEMGYSPVPGTSAVVVTGHRDRSMSEHLQDLKDAGVLRGKLVAVISCYEQGSERFQSDLITGPKGATAVVFYPTAIKAQAVELVMLELSRLISRETVGLSPSRLDSLLERSVDRALEAAGTPSEREEIEKLRHALIQLSRLRPPTPASDIDT